MPKRVKIDIDIAGKLAALQCTDVEIASFFGVSQKTIQRKKADKKFLEAIEMGQAKGRMSIKRKQFELALAGNPTMLIWVGKQYLGQTDRQMFEHSGAGPGGAISIDMFRKLISDTDAPKGKVNGKTSSFNGDNIPVGEVDGAGVPEIGHTNGKG